MAKTVDITASYVGSDITSVDIYNSWPGGTLLSGSFTGNKIKTGVRLTGIPDSVFDFVLVDTATSQSSNLASLPGPTVTDFNPKSGTSGDIIGVTGSGFIGTTEISLGTKNVTSFVTSSNNNITLTVPTDASGSTFLLVVNPKGSALRSGWQYTVGGQPVVYDLGDFDFELNPDDACSAIDPQFELSLYTDQATTIQEAFELQVAVYTDTALNTQASVGWYKQIPVTNSYIYYVDSNGIVSDRTDCSTPPPGSGGSEEEENFSETGAGGSEIIGIQ